MRVETSSAQGGAALQIISDLLSLFPSLFPSLPLVSRAEHPLAELPERPRVSNPGLGTGGCRGSPPRLPGLGIPPEGLRGAIPGIVARWERRDDAAALGWCWDFHCPGIFFSSGFSLPWDAAYLGFSLLWDAAALRYSCSGVF